MYHSTHMKLESVCLVAATMMNFRIAGQEASSHPAIYASHLVIGMLGACVTKFDFGDEFW